MGEWSKKNEIINEEDQGMVMKRKVRFLIIFVLDEVWVMSWINVIVVMIVISVILIIMILFFWLSIVHTIWLAWMIWLTIWY